MLRAVLQFFSRLAPAKVAVASDWDSTVAAASEEWVDSTRFEFTPNLPGPGSIEDLVQRIVEAARADPDQAVVLRTLSAEFVLSEGEVLSAVDRALGGIVRAAAKNPDARPCAEIDPVAAISFDIASNDLGVIDDVYPGWQEWPPGDHSERAGASGSENEEAEQATAQNPENR